MTAPRDELLKQAARDYLLALEKDDPDETFIDGLEEIEKAKDHLAAIAVLWAQAEIIDQIKVNSIVSKKNSAPKTKKA